GQSFHGVEELKPPISLDNHPPMFTDRDGKLWFITRTGVTTLDGEKWSAPITPTNDSILPDVGCGLQDTEGRIWLGTTYALVRLDPKGGTWKLYRLQGLAGADLIYEDRQGRLWLADSSGHLAVYDKSRERWASYDFNILFPVTMPQYISAIYQDKA